MTETITRDAPTDTDDQESEPVTTATDDNTSEDEVIDADIPANRPERCSKRVMPFRHRSSASGPGRGAGFQITSSQASAAVATISSTRVSTTTIAR